MLLRGGVWQHVIVPPLLSHLVSRCLEMWYRRSQTCPAHPESVPSGSLSDLATGAGPPPTLAEKGDRGVDTAGGGFALVTVETH